MIIMARVGTRFRTRIRHGAQRRSCAARSALFAADAEAARHVVAVVNPDLDFDHLFSHLRKHQEILTLRGYDVGLQNLMRRWQTWEELGHRLHQLNDAKVAGVSADEKNALKRNLQEEAKFMYDALALPNWLLPENVTRHDKVIHKAEGGLPDFGRGHLYLAGKLQQILPAATGSSFYLMGQAAQFELLAQRRLCQQLLAMKFEPLSCPDLFKPVAVEGSGFDLDDRSVPKLISDSTDPLDVKTLRLAGSATLVAFGAYFTRVKFLSGDLPRSYYSLGRLYRCSGGPPHCGGLLRGNQSAALAFVTLMAENPELEFELAVEQLKNIFAEIGVHFQLVESGATNLAREESRRCRLEIWSTTFNRFVPVAFVSAVDDYVSRRLICCYDDADIVDDRHYINMIHGRIDVTHLLAVIMENTQDVQGLWHIPKYFTN